MPNSGGQRTGLDPGAGSRALSAPELNLFAVDSGGRPFDAAYAQSTTDLAAGSIWSFRVTVPTAFNKYLAFPVWGQQ